MLIKLNPFIQFTKRQILYLVQHCAIGSTAKKPSSKQVQSGNKIKTQVLKKQKLVSSGSLSNSALSVKQTGGLDKSLPLKAALFTIDPISKEQHEAALNDYEEAQRRGIIDHSIEEYTLEEKEKRSTLESEMLLCKKRALKELQYLREEVYWEALNLDLHITTPPAWRRPAGLTPPLKPPFYE